MAVTGFAEGLWLVEGPVVRAALGFRYPTRMAVLRLAGGGLALWSPVTFSAALAGRIADLGRVEAIVLPNSLHHLWAGEWQAALPEARLLLAPGLAAKRPDLRGQGLDGGDGAGSLAARGLPHVLFEGNRITTEAVFFHRESGTVLFTDLLQNLPRGWFGGWRDWVARADLMSEAEPTVPRKFRLAFRDRAALSQALAAVRAWPVRNVVLAHGTPCRGRGAALLARAFDWAGGTG